MFSPRLLEEVRFEVEGELGETLRLDCWSYIRVDESERHLDCQEGFEADHDPHLCFHVGHLGCSHLCCKIGVVDPDDYVELGSSFQDGEVKVESHRRGYLANMFCHLSSAFLLLPAPSDLRLDGQSNQTYGTEAVLASDLCWSR